MTITADQPPPSPEIDALPDPETPAPDEGKPRAKKQRSPLWARLSVAFGTVLLVASGGGLVGGKVLISQTTDSIALENLTGDAKKTEAEGGGATIEGPIDMLLMGVDARERWAADELRSDTIIILHIPASHDQAYLISIPRDTEVQAPEFGPSKYEGGTVKATEAFYWGAQNGAGWTGGAQLLAKTLKNMTGISFDGAGIINFGGFKKVIDQLGGVKMCVDQEVTSKHMKLVGGEPMWLADARKTGKPMKDVVHKVGCKEMEGWEALDYARQRYGLKNGDYDRQRHQQQLIKAMAKKAAGSGILSNPLKIGSIIQSAGEALVMDVGDIELTDFVLGLSGVAANDMVLLRTNNGTFSGNGNGREVLNEKSKEMFQAVKNDNLAQFVLDNPDVVASEK
ncbi:putative cell envelope-related transcriptional attenuator [Actinoplanes missouriensis 431]|uniref:Putative cell envelope-related transcriptional attenuator n=1 Tax=Actinoplanes missouriensis (strain ATCC 14538 / DSM 43046 / CBS 188.64 / JCM 3121 / NBRC 102363 / NCIMB 12654 / NRRL B-3342 / UNCC 431) TaxID=512565 RepID=I0HJS0_ACTM4|nr:LCP family protein [Actinoplanes missouriensis]BAL93257.1 putative cell envelope-related transcriptional attenuator [Actinoplanes missouriensis 431]